jgi:5-methylcytosine-specific restriction endonuclease McrA
MSMFNYAEYLESPQWQTRRRAAFERARNACTLCPETRALEVHHRTYSHIGNERDEDLVVLCYWCHRKHHGTLTSNRQRARCTENQLWLEFEPMVPQGPELN